MSTMLNVAVVGASSAIDIVYKQLRKSSGLNVTCVENLHDIEDSYSSMREMLFLLKPRKKELDYLLLDNPKFNKKSLRKNLNFNNIQKNKFIQRTCLHVMHQKG